MAKQGKAAILWSSTSDQATERVHLLEAPLRRIRPGLALATFTRESLDKSNVEYYSIGSGNSTAGAYELVGTVRYDVDSQSLVDLIRAGSQGKTLTYVPRLDDRDQAISVKLLSPLGDAGVAVDEDRAAFAEHTVELRFRTTAGAMWERPIHHGHDVLFWWRAGDSLETATFTRVTASTAPAYYASNSGGGGFGTLSSAKSNKARIEWVST